MKAGDEEEERRGEYGTEGKGVREEGEGKWKTKPGIGEKGGMEN